MKALSRRGLFKIVACILSLFVTVAIIPVIRIQAEGVLSTDKTKYPLNDPVIVTATEGKWVGVYKKGEEPSVKKDGYFYAFEVDGQPHNIYDGVKGTRGASFVASIPQIDLTVYLFGDDGYDNVLETVDIHINGSTSTSSLSVNPETKEGDPVEISASSDYRDAWVGIYEGTFTSSDTFSDKGIESFYVCYAQNKGKDIDGLTSGEYTAVLFKKADYTVDKAVNFKVLKEDEPVTPVFTDKEVYDIEEPVYVTTNYYSEGAWVGLYEKGAAEDPEQGGVQPLYCYSLSEMQPQRMNILEGTAIRAEDYKPGEFTVTVFGDSGYTKPVSSKDITVIKAEKGSVTADKAKYMVNEPILVTAEGGKWVGIYKYGEVPSEIKNGYFYRLPADGEAHNVYSGEKGNRATSFIASIPKSFKIAIILFGDDGYDNILDTVTVQTTTTTEESKLHTDPEYEEGDKVFIQASSNERDAWVGIYSGLFPENYDFSTINPAEKFYVANKDNAGSDILGLHSGFYTAVLFSGSGYTVDKTEQFVIRGEAKVALTTDKDEYEEYEGIYVTTDYDEKGWVGLFLKEEWNLSHTEYLPLYRYDISEKTESRNILESTPVRADEFGEGEYTIVLFSGSDTAYPVAEKNIKVKKLETTVLTEATCESYGYVKVKREGEKAEYHIVDPLGHTYGEWIFNADKLSHSRICSRDPSHTEEEWCSFDNGEIIKEATFFQPGEKMYTCMVCGGTYTEEYELDGDFERYFGETRYETSISIARKLKASLGLDEFEAVILASGDNYPDALSGAFLAYQYKAPILLIRDVEKNAAPVIEYIKKNLSEKGTVYILGGESAVPASIEKDFSEYTVSRIAGATRYETNLEILSQAEISSEDILICTGGSFADSLSASAVKRPILLVKDQLTENQIAFLASHKDNQFYIIGGEKAVNASVEKQLSEIHSCKRLSGATRYETSTLIAKEFFEDPYAAVLAYGQNFPDGLCGGPLAIAENTPLILTMETMKNYAKEYCSENDISKAAVLGGTILISDETVKDILVQKKDEETEKAYSIKYVLNGGINTIANPLTYKEGETVTLTDPHREGFLFNGWFTDRLLLKPFAGFTSSTKGNLLLYARWKEAPLDITVTGTENMIWSWWYSPQVISADNKVFWGFAENGGYSGIAQYDNDTGKTKKTFVKKAVSIDDHNGVAITLMDDGRILSAFAGGHNKDRLIHIRISNEPYDVENFDTEVILQSSGKTCYSQLLHYNNKICVFYRINNNSWAYRETADGVNWSDEVILISAPEQYYCKFVPTTDDSLFRVLMYSNPSGSDPNIRMGFFNPAKGTLLNSDGITYLGSNKVSHTEFDVLIERPAGLTQRLFDVAVTEPALPKVLYSTFSSSKTALNSEYYLYSNGSSTKICNGGHPLMNPKYQLGAMFAGNDRIILSRNENDTDFIELYSIKGKDVSLEKSIYSETTSEGIRNARPISDAEGKVILWHSGYYNEKGYTDFETEAKISFLP